MPSTSNRLPGDRAAAEQRLLSAWSTVSGSGSFCVAVILTDHNRYVVTDSDSTCLLLLLFLSLFVAFMGITWILVRVLSRREAKPRLTLLIPAGTARVISAQAASSPGPATSAADPANSRPISSTLSESANHHPTIKLKLVS